MQRLFECLVQELERARPLPAQVARHLEATYATERDDVGPFLEKELDRLEDYEVDLILSPAFTPTLADQAIVAPLLGGQSLSADQINALIRQIAERPTTAQLVPDDGVTRAVRLREVTIERYVRRLRLEGAIPDGLRETILRHVPLNDQAMILAVARRAVWNVSPRRALLEHYLENAGAAFNQDDLLVLWRLVETYEPADAADFRARLPGWVESVRRGAADAASPKPFFNERVEDLHGGGRDHRRGHDPKAVQRQAELQSMLRLQQTFA